MVWFIANQSHVVAHVLTASLGSLVHAADAAAATTLSREKETRRVKLTEATIGGDTARHSV